MTSGELELVEWLRAAFPQEARDGGETARGDIPIGDDMGAAVIGGGETLVTADMLMDGVHFLSETHSAPQIGRKALACSLSDCAAMAVRPRSAIVSLALPRSWSLDRVKGLFEGMRPLLERFEMSLLGGDTNSWDGRLVVDVTVIAEAWPGLAPVRRNGARVGDAIWVSGRLGGSLAERHLTFDPRVTEARRLRERLGDQLHAMMDITDGLALDLSRLCKASAVGAELSVNELESVISDAARQAAHGGIAASGAAAESLSALEHALSDGEDFELLFTVDPAANAETIRVAVGAEARRVGAIVASGFYMTDVTGVPVPLAPRGWSHGFSAGDAS